MKTRKSPARPVHYLMHPDDRPGWGLTGCKLRLLENPTTSFPFLVTCPKCLRFLEEKSIMKQSAGWPSIQENASALIAAIKLASPDNNYREAAIAAACQSVAFAREAILSGIPGQPS